MSAIIGALRAELSASIAQFQSDMGKAADSLRGFTKEAKAISRDLDDVGRKMSLAITAPLALLAKASLDQAKAAREAIGQVESAIDSTGGSVGRTVPQLVAMAKSLQNISVFDKNDILRNVTANLVTFGNLQGPIFDRAQKAVVNLASRMGGDLAGSAIKVGRALNDPIQGTAALTRLGVQFTTQEKLQIKALVDAGKGQEAQGIILDRLTQKYGGAAEALRKASPDAQLIQSWRDFKETIGKILIEVLPPLVDFLKSALEAFQKLTPGMQQFIVVAGGVLATVGPILLLLGGIVSVAGELVPLIKGLGIAMAGAALPVLAVAAALAVLAAAIYASQQISKAATKAITDQDDAHKLLADTMEKAAAAARDMTAEERDAAAQKLKLAENTLKAALAQEKQNLAENENRMKGGVFSQAAEDVKALAHGQAPPEIQMVQEKNAIKQLQDSLTSNLADQQNLFDSAAPTLPIKLKFDPHNEAEIAKAKGALQSLDEELTQMNINLQHGLDDLALPKATAQAIAMNARLDDYVKRAKDAGANTSVFAVRIETLRARIAELQKQGVAREALDFAKAVDDDQLAVDRFAKGGLPALAEKLANVDDTYKSLHDRITDEITKNAALADSNDEARKTMEKLQAMLASLEDAHKKATAAAVAQSAAEQKLADLQTQGSNLETSNQIRDMQNTLTGKGPTSTVQQDLQDANDQLAKKQIEVAETLAKLEQERAVLVEQNQNHENDKQIANLDSEITLQKQLSDLVTQTTGAQLVAAKQVNEAFKEFADNLATQLSDMISNWSFDLKGLMNVFRQLAEQLFIKPAVTAGTNALSDLLKSGLTDLFSGAHAAGGYIPPGQWGIVGEKGPEPVFGGHAGMDVFPNGSGSGGITQVFNISTPDANSFRRSARQVQRSAKLRLAMS